MCALIGLGLSFDCGCPWICTARVVTVLTPDCGLVRSMARSELGEDVSEDELQAMIAEFDSTKTGRSESRPTSSSSFFGDTVDTVVDSHRSATTLNDCSIGDRLPIHYGERLLDSLRAQPHTTSVHLQNENTWRLGSLSYICTPHHGPHNTGVESTPTPPDQTILSLQALRPIEWWLLGLALPSSYLK